MHFKRGWLAMVGAGALTIGFWTVAPVQAQATWVSTPTAQYFTTTALPDPSEALALDTRTNNVFAMTEAEPGGEGGVDTDAVTVAATPQCGEDQHDIAVINGRTGAVKRYIPISGEAEYMAVDPGLGKLYVPQYNDAGLAAPQCLAVVDINPASPTAWTVQYFPIPFTYKDTGFQYNPTGVAVDKATHVVYLGGKMPEIEGEGTGGAGDNEFGEGAIMAFDGVGNAFFPTFVPAGDDPESLVFNGKTRRVFTANEDEGTLTVTSAITRGAGGVGWNTARFTADAITTGRVFDASECPVGTYQPFEADKLAVNERTGTVYLTDDRFRVAAIPGNVGRPGGPGVANVPILRLSPDGTCPTSPDPAIYNYANNVVIDPGLGSVLPGGGKAGLLYVTSENHLVSIVDLLSFTKVGAMTIGDANGLARHIDWPVINPNTHRFYISDELRPAVFIYNLGQKLTWVK